MRPVNEKLQSTILEEGKKEFLAVGYQKASLRTIAKHAGVTTGAVYKYFADKEALFDALVKEAAEGLEEQYRREQNQFAALPAKEQVVCLVGGFQEISSRGSGWMIDYIYSHFTAFKLIVCHAAGTKYENYREGLVQIEAESSLRFIQVLRELGRNPLPVDEGLSHILSNMLFSGIFETVAHDMPKEKALEYIESLQAFYSAGWFQLLGLSREPL